MASQIHLWFPFFLWCFSKLQLTLLFLPPVPCLCMCIFHTGLGAEQSRRQHTKEKRKQMLPSNIRKTNSALCVCSLALSNASSIFDALLPLWRWLRESDTVPPSLSESVSRNVETELLLCSVRLAHAPAGVSLWAMSFSAGTLSLRAFLA